MQKPILGINQKIGGEKMRPYVFMAGILFLILIAGCTTQTEKYLQLTSEKEQIITTQDSYDLKFFVKNPTINTFTGTVEYQYNDKCLKSSRIKEEVEITPKQQQKGIINTVSYNQYGYPNPPDVCFQTPLRVTVILKDKGGDIKDFFDVQLTIAKN